MVNGLCNVSLKYKRSTRNQRQKGQMIFIYTNSQKSVNLYLKDFNSETVESTRTELVEVEPSPKAFDIVDRNKV